MRLERSLIKKVVIEMATGTRRLIGMHMRKRMPPERRSGEGVTFAWNDSV